MPPFYQTARIFAAALAQLHPMLTGKTAKDLSKFIGAMDSVNVARIAFLRHGKTGPSTTGKDFDRLLAEEGREQAKEAGRVFGKELLPYYSPVLVSSASRTVETAQLFLDSCDTSNSVDLNPVQELYDGTMQPEGSSLFGKIGYAPLRTYLENKNDEDRAIAQSVLGAYAYSAVDAILDATAESGRSHSPSTLCVVGHAVYLPAAALGIASLAGCDDTEVALATNTKEAEGYVIDFESSSIKYLSRER